MNDSYLDDRLAPHQGSRGSDALDGGDAPTGNEGIRATREANDEQLAGTAHEPPGPTPSPGSPELSGEVNPTAVNDMDQDGDLAYLRASPYNLH